MTARKLVTPAQRRARAAERQARHRERVRQRAAQGAALNARMADIRLVTRLPDPPSFLLEVGALMARWGWTEPVARLCALHEPGFSIIDAPYPVETQAQADEYAWKASAVLEKMTEGR